MRDKREIEWLSQIDSTDKRWLEDDAELFERVEDLNDKVNESRISKEWLFFVHARRYRRLTDYLHPALQEAIPENRKSRKTCI